MIYDSIIISFVFSLWQRICAAYSNCFTSRLIRKLSYGFKELFANSSIWAFIKKDSYLSGIWEYSFSYRFFFRLINFPSNLCAKVYNKLEPVLLNSFCFNFIKSVLDKFEILIGLSMAFIIIVPHNYWNNIYSTLIVILLVLLYALKAVYEKNEYFNVKALDFTFILFMAAIVMSVATSVFPRESFRFLIFYLTCFLLVLVIVSAIKTGRAMNSFLQILSLGIAATGVYGVWEAAIGVAIDASLVDIRMSSNLVGRISSTVGNPNNYAEIVILAVPFMLALVFNTEGFINKMKYLILTVFPIIALSLTGARISMAAFAFSILVFIFLKNRKLIPAALILGILCFPLIPQSIILRLQSALNPNDSSIGYRIQIYKTIIPMFKDFWATGIGLGTGLGSDPFMVVIQRYYLWTKNQIPPHTQNLYLQIWLEAGLAGIITFLWFMARVVKNSLSDIFRKKDEYINNVLIAGVSSLAGIAVVAVAEHIWFYPRVMLFFWMDIGIILAGLNILAKRKELKNAGEK